MKIRYSQFRKGLTFLILLIGFPFFIRAQHNTCENSDFSSGTFANWTGYTSVYPYNTPGTNIGTPQSPYPSPAYYYKQGIVSGRHTIITTATPDPFTCGKVMTLPPGEKQCVRLGNGGLGPWGNGVTWQREYLTYDFTITPNNALVIYKYVAVLQDPFPHHEKPIKPRFIVSLRDTQDKGIDSLCTMREIYADSIASMMHSCSESVADSLGGKTESPGDILYSDWTTIGLDMRPYIGKTVHLKFETWDCGLGGHFGYAYLTAKCAEMKINASTCAPGGSVTLTAPEGFSYKWLPSGEITQSIVINNAKMGDSASVELTSSNGCKSFLTTKLFTNFPTANFDVDSMLCVGQPIHFTDKSLSVNEYWNWNFGDGSIDSVQNPVHTYSTKGNYSVRLVVRNSDGCADSIVRIINICPALDVHDQGQTLAIRAYPNPSTGLYKLEIGQANIANVQVQIADVLGRVVYAENNSVKNGSLQKELDIKEQPDGIYFLTIKTPEYSKVIKLIKKN